MLNFTQKTLYAKAMQIVDQVIATDTYLAANENKAPHTALNNMLGSLVAMVSPVYDPEIVCSVLNHPAIISKMSSLRDNLGKCEYALEKEWANKIILGNKAYTDYPYIDHYRSLVAEECNLLMQYREMQSGNTCFIGSGPMPLTVFEFQKRFPAISVTCIEMEDEAILLSKNVSALSDMPLQFIHSKADQVNYSSYDVISIAAMTSDKPTLLKQIESTAKSGTIVSLRSVEDLRHLLYEPLDLKDIPQTFKYLDKIAYKPEHVNTTLFFRLEK